MKRTIFIFTIGLLTLVQFAVSAQHGKKGEDMWKKFQSEKIAFLTSKMDMSPDEAQKFWPIYNQLDKERWEAQKMRREMELKLREAEESFSDKQVTELTRKFTQSLQNEANLGTEYNEKFLKILPPKKVLRLYNAENEFRMHMIKKFRDQRKDEDKQP